MLNVINHKAISTVKSGSPWLHGITYLTADTLDRVFWKGQFIDFVKEPFEEESQSYLLELASRCRHLEELDIPINIETVVHFGHWFIPMSKDHPYKDLLLCCPDIRVSNKQIMLIMIGDQVAEYDGKQWCYHCKKSDQPDSEWFALWDQFALEAKGYTGLPLCYSDLDGLSHCLRYFHVPVDLRDQLNKQFTVDNRSSRSSK